jgi:hypothetical protein
MLESQRVGGGLVLLLVKEVGGLYVTTYFVNIIFSKYGRAIQIYSK